MPADGIYEVFRRIKRSHQNMQLMSVFSRVLGVLRIFNSAIIDELLCVLLSLHQYGPYSKCLRTNSAAICPRTLCLHVKLRFNADIPGLGTRNMRSRLLNVQPSTHTDV